MPVRLGLVGGGWISRQHLEALERLYLRLLFPRKRSGEGGAMKHYVGLTEESGVIFTGMEVVRRDWTDLHCHSLAD